ncbi:hypothetical protein [Paracoccus amoyensis]|uniref:hypothetical protein n=1 Tax=Paracoccus amoyensis TaxID=2760093 RepID=UPI001658D66C|nr:hypothetical protein [Paracoccus amoyensis]
MIETADSHGPVAQLFLPGPFELLRGQSESGAPRFKTAQTLLALAPRRERYRSIKA